VRVRSAHFCGMKIFFFFFLLIENTTPHICTMCMCIYSRSSSSSSSSSSGGGGGARAAFLLILSLFVRRRKSQRNAINYNLFYAYSILSSLFSLSLSIRVLSLYLNRIGCIFFCLDAKSSAESLRFIRWNDLRCNSYKSLNALTYAL